MLAGSWTNKISVLIVISNTPCVRGDLETSLWSSRAVRYCLRLTVSRNCQLDIPDSIVSQREHCALNCTKGLYSIAAHIKSSRRTDHTPALHLSLHHSGKLTGTRI